MGLLFQVNIAETKRYISRNLTGPAMLNWIFLLKREWKPASLTALCMLISILFEGFGIGLMTPLMQEMLGGSQNGFFSDVSNILLAYIGLEPSLPVLLSLICGAVLLKTLFTVAREFMRSFLGYNFKQKTISLMNEQLFQRSYSEIIRTPHGTHFNNIVVETQAVSQGLIQLAEIIISIFYIIIFVCVAMLTDPFLTLSAAIFTGAFFSTIYFTVRQFATEMGTKEVEFNQKLNSQISENISLNKEYRVSGMSSFAALNVQNTARFIRNIVVKWDTVTGGLAPLVELFLTVGLTGAILFYSQNDPHNQADLFATLAVFTLIGLRLLQRSVRLTTSIISVRKYTASLSAIMPFIQPNGLGEKPLNSVPVSPIRFDNVTIYGRERQAILKNLNFEIPLNSVTIFLGPSGSGKTSIIETMVGLRPDYDGEIYYDQTNLRDISDSSIMDNIAVASQDVALFNLSLGSNIAGKMRFDKVAVDRIINMLSLGKFIDTLEDGYATLVGERGNLLSGGQKQRVLLARAMLYDSAYLFLDEPTSALDNRTEENVVKMLEKLKGKKTIIITTHRQSLLSLADTVFEIADKTLTRGH